MNSSLKIINETIKLGSLQPFLAILKGTRNGIVYGAKVRFAHEVVISILFRKGNLKQKIIQILQATRKHATNLGSFVFIYKSILLILKLLRSTKIEKSYDTFIAGLIAGYWIFGRENSSLNQQIVLYLFARVAIGCSKLIVKKTNSNAPSWTWAAFASIVWGLVMWLFKHEPETLQLSLQSSMQYLYVDSERWNDLRTLIWHNK
eukprot:TRINITY_DN3215_c3_g1_i1.p1 TRINITY_DN3215_c3_g1~~TRINITY_DN3215_c3_g1_i1.p1  ORF type:complete len:204 (+),score=93.02 TRINITY_DN3215_c3_g1_i1:17-628(+)